jgi:Fe-S cluster biosynthesis and repair protein YggX
MVICNNEGCDKHACFNYPTEIKGIYCFSHKKLNMIDIIHKKCIFEGCNKIPVFNLPTENNALYCNTHKKLNMVDIIHKKCIFKDCNTRPNYNLPTEINPLYCNIHKKLNMVDIINKRCNEDNCFKRPNYNLPTEINPLYCFSHKRDNMIDIINKRCNEDNCLIRPSFNYPNIKKGIYCNKHKKLNMINIKNKKCLEKDCNKQPIFNLPNNKQGIYCNDHKKLNMIDIKHKKCLEKNCVKGPSFNLSTESTPLYCNEHKKLNMINITSNKCQHPKCKSISIYGLKDKKPQFCKEHKLINHINLVLENKCSIKDCENEYEFIIDNIKKCFKHAPKEYEINIKRLCKFCDLGEVFEKSDYICDEHKAQANKKEWTVVRYLKKNINTKFIFNSNVMLNGCSKRRPDVFFELNKHCLIVEVDENQHRNYEDNCECARISEIVGSIGGKSVIFIRFNPDKTKNKGKILKFTLEERLIKLVELIKKELIKEYDKFIVKIIQLYYDDDYDVYKSIKKEDITNKVCI